MDEIHKPELAEKYNPETRVKHRREGWWQISLPLSAGLLVVLVLSVAVTYGSHVDVSRWAQISMVWLVLPLIFFAVLFLVALVGMIYVLARLSGILPDYAYKTQNLFARMTRISRQVADKAVEPVLRLNALKASMRALIRR
jgi:lipopolysaccharide export LptBFGC system permease protein LptF